MKKIFWIPLVVLTIAVVFASCLKNDDVAQCTPNTIEQDRRAIDSFIITNGASYLVYNSMSGSIASGAYSGIANSGSGNEAALDSIVAFKRTYSAFNGSQMISIGSDSVSKNNSGTDLKYSDVQNDAVLKNFLDNAALGGILRVVYPSSFNPVYYGCPSATINGVTIPAYSQIIIDYTLTGIKRGS